MLRADGFLEQAEAGLRMNHPESAGAMIPPQIPAEDHGPMGPLLQVHRVQLVAQDLELQLLSVPEWGLEAGLR